MHLQSTPPGFIALFNIICLLQRTLESKCQGLQEQELIIRIVKPGNWLAGGAPEMAICRPLLEEWRKPDGYFPSLWLGALGFQFWGHRVQLSLCITSCQSPSRHLLDTCQSSLLLVTSISLLETCEQDFKELSWCTLCNIVFPPFFWLFFQRLQPSQVRLAESRGVPGLWVLRECPSSQLWQGRPFGEIVAAAWSGVSSPRPWLFLQVPH